QLARHLRAPAGHHLLALPAPRQRAREAAVPGGARSLAAPGLNVPATAPYEGAEETPARPSLATFADLSASDPDKSSKFVRSIRIGGIWHPPSARPPPAATLLLRFVARRAHSSAGGSRSVHCSAAC